MPGSSSAPDSNRDEVLQQLERILAHPLFHKSERLSSFLRVSVETTLAGEADRLKEFVIGTEVFKRGDSFDPQTDNIVRVNANRIQNHLCRRGEEIVEEPGDPKFRFCCHILVRIGSRESMLRVQRNSR